MKKFQELVAKFSSFIPENSVIFVLVFISIANSFVFSTISNSFVLTFLDVGQGDSILIKTPGGKYILIDGGEDEKVLEQLGKKLPFWNKKIDIVIGTHADSDHIGGLVYVIEKYDVKEVFISIPSSDNNIYNEIEKRLASQDKTIKYLESGDMIRANDIEITVLWPTFEGEKRCLGENNPCSTVLAVNYKGFDFILTGDIESEQELEIKKVYNLAGVEILKLAHHGSKTASDERFLKEVDPEIAVISVGADNKFKHPSEEVIEMLEKYNITYLRTDDSGWIDFIINPNNEFLLVSKEKEVVIAD